MQSAHGNLARVYCLRHSGDTTCCACYGRAEREGLECPRRQCSTGCHCECADQRAWGQTQLKCSLVMESKKTMVYVV
jgi:hypothetical protein